ncbi:MAG TPA: M20 family metallopeptidase [Candidatus Limnocylindrales bacterium]|nr:M20 family metallopeptidase [Candidatus Limnocylindrales bacterium]
MTDAAAPPVARPVQPEIAAAKARVADAVRARRDEIITLSHAIHADPEPAFEEHRAAERVAAAIRGAGFTVEHPAGSLATAVRGRLVGGRGPDGPRIGILAEYDALPGLGHGCGHNTMAAQGVGSALALADVRDAWAGEVVFLGTPAEERGSGKAIMIADGLFEGLDAALLYHPCDRNHVESHPLASEDVEVVFRGLQSHAASDPWKGRNALDAMIALFVSVGLWRQQLEPHMRVHGIIQEGGTAANIIPDRTRCWFMIRSADQASYEGMKRRFRQLAEAAALAADCEVEITFSGGAMTMKPNPTLERLWRANAEAAGVPDEGPDPGSGSTDMGNVSWTVPSIHPDLAIVDQTTPGHSIAFRDAAAMPRADETTLLAATLVAQTALDLLLDRDLVAAAWEDFRRAS